MRTILALALALPLGATAYGQAAAPDDLLQERLARLAVASDDLEVVVQKVERGAMLIRGVGLRGVPPMKKIALIFVLLQITLPLAAAGKPNPADFPVKIHVVFSRYVLSAGPYQQIEAVIDGQRVELVGQSNGLLALGDYSARVATDKQLPRSGPRHPNSYDLYKGYELLMADGKTRTYQVTAMGQTEFPVAPLPAAPVVPDTTPAPMATPPPPPPTPPTL